MLERILGPAGPDPVFHPSWGGGTATIWWLVITIGSMIAAFAANDMGLLAATLPDGKPDLGAFEWAIHPLEIALVLLVASRFRLNPFKVLAFRPPVRVRRVIALTLAVVIACIVVVLGLAAWLGTDDFLESPNQETNEQLIRNSPLLGNLVMTGLIAPVAEEMLYRGFLLLAFFNTRLWFWGAAVISSLLFAIMHNPTSLNLLFHAPYFVFALGLAMALRYTGSLWVPIGLHVLKNSIAVLLIST
jgi:membrane protease YdiL (CAAX protease family)